MSLTFYVLRHRPTGKLMPRYTGAGYTWWEPETEKAKPPRLFNKKQYAELAKRQWEAGKLVQFWNEEQDAFTEVRESVRSKDELEIVEVLLSLLS